jgi:hypothetical protein
MTYRPYHCGFAHKVIEFFVNNPDEELSSSDMTVKWPNQNRRTIHTLLRPAVANQCLIRYHNDDDIIIYQAGPNILLRDAK